MPSTLEAALEGRKTVETAGEFPAIVDFSKQGDWILGEYQGKRAVTMQGRAVQTHIFKLLKWETTFKRNKVAYAPKVGDLVSASGAVLDRGLLEVGIGQTVGVEFVGMGEKKGTQSPAKVFSVRPVIA